MSLHTLESQQVIREMAGLLSTFLPYSAEHPEQCIPIAEAVYDQILTREIGREVKAALRESNLLLGSGRKHDCTDCNMMVSLYKILSIREIATRTRRTYEVVRRNLLRHGVKLSPRGGFNRRYK